MGFTQETFFGASIRSFNASVGWGTQTSTCSIELVEDSKNGDSFAPHPVGSPAYFDYQGWKFGGVLQGYQQQYGRGGNPTYSVQLQDPRELLDGVQLILQDYTGGTYSVPNLYNIYGYLESTHGFGGAETNDTGIPWKLVRDAFYQLQLTSPINFRGYSYICTAFYGMDLLPDDYRIGGDVISAMGFIDEICSALSYDFFITLISNSSFSASNSIVVNLVNRSYPLRTGVIDEFVTNINGAVSKSQGYEFRNETVSKFVVGGALNNLYFQDQGYNTDENYYDDIILPYWGYDSLDNLIIGNGNFNGKTGSEYTFRIDGRPMYIQTGISRLNNYKTDLAEMRAIRVSQDRWESFLAFYDQINTSIHYGKATLLGIDGGINRKVIEMLAAARKVGGVLPRHRPVTKGPLSKPKAGKTDHKNEEHKRKLSRIYKYLHKYATEYYGKKFMVRIPFVYAKREPETNDIIFSVEPTDSAYVDESNWGTATSLGYMPYNAEKFTTKDNKIVGYVKFGNMHDVTKKDDDGNIIYTIIKSKYILDKLSPASYIIDQRPNLAAGNMRENLFVKCTLDPKLVFLYSATLYSPRVVITLDAPVANEQVDAEQYTQAAMNEIIEWLKASDSNLDHDKVDSWAVDYDSGFGDEFMWAAKDAMLQLPDMAALPLKSNVLRYGPWYITNNAGKVEFENDSSLVPWNYGGFTALNLAGWAKVEDALSGQQVGEQGTVEFPGVPNIQLGHVLLSSGPVVTDINVDIGENGATTTYRMNTWSFQFGRLGKYNVEKFARFSRMKQEQRKAFRKLYGYPEPLSVGIYGDENDGDQTDTTGTVLTGDVIVEGEGEDRKVMTNVASTTTKRVTETVSDATYINKAGMSFDGMFTPFTTSVDLAYSSDLPCFETPEVDASVPTSQELNPFCDGGIAVAFPESSGVPDNLSNEFGYAGDVKGIGLKAPIVVGGWGYDTSGNPVPNSGDAFVKNYKQRADLWKVGPLDIRWDDKRKVWNASGSGQIKIGKLVNNVFSGGSGTVVIYDFDGSNYYNTGEMKENVRDWLLLDGYGLNLGTNVIIEQIGNYWYVVAAQPPC